MDILVKKDFSVTDIKKAAAARAEFRPTRATSAASNVLNMADLGKAVLLCSDHTKQFATPAVLSKYNYRRSEAYPEVMGTCDYCKLNGPCALFEHLSVYAQVLRTRAQRRADFEYASVVTG